MPKKVIDISPLSPQKESKILPNVKQKRPVGWLSIILISLAVIVLGGVIFFSLNSRLYLTISPRLNEKEISDTFEVRTQAPQDLSFENRIIPGRFFESEVKLSKQFKATGKEEKGSKARGKIIVYNEYRPPTPINLVPSRFLSGKEQKIFWSLNKIHIPPAKIINGDFVPGTVEIEVEAEKPGEDYNIPPTTFSLPALVGTPFYQYIYAKSDKPMTGGFKKEVDVIRAEDLQKAREKLWQELLEKGRQQLEEEAGPDMIILKRAVKLISSPETSIECLGTEGLEVSSFSCEGQSPVKGIGFSKKDLQELAEKVILSELEPQSTIVKDQMTFEFSNGVFVLEKGKLVFDIKIKVPYYKEISLTSLKAQIAGMNKEGIRETIFALYPQVKKITLKFSPFWMWRAPKNPENIEAEIR